MSIQARAATGCHTLSVQLVSWRGNGDKANGAGCDPWPFSSMCDPYFSICIDKKQPGSLGSTQWKSDCSYQSEVRTSTYQDTTNVDFQSYTQLRQFFNPASFSKNDQWTGARVYVKVTEEDVSSNDHLDIHVIDLPGRNLDQKHFWAYPNSQLQYAHRWIDVQNQAVNYAETGSTMSVKYRPVCCKNYYNYDCSVHCIPQAGIYTCDPLTGDRILEPTEPSDEISTTIDTTTETNRDEDSANTPANKSSKVLKESASTDSDSDSLTYILIGVGLFIGLMITILIIVIVVVFCHKKKRDGNVDEERKVPNSNTENDNAGYQEPTDGEEHYTEIGGSSSMHTQYRINSVLPDGQEEGNNGGGRRQEDGYLEIIDPCINPGSPDRENDDDTPIQYRQNTSLPQ